MIHNLGMVHNYSTEVSSKFCLITGLVAIFWIDRLCTHLCRIHLEYCFIFIGMYLLVQICPNLDWLLQNVGMFSHLWFYRLKWSGVFCVITWPFLHMWVKNSHKRYFDCFGQASLVDNGTGQKTVVVSEGCVTVWGRRWALMEQRMELSWCFQVEHTEIKAGYLLLLNVLLDVLRPYMLGGLIDSESHLGHVVGWRRGRSITLGEHLLRYGPLGHHVVSVGVNCRVSIGGPAPRLCWKGVGGHRLLFACLPLWARLADTELRPEAHSSILALREAVGYNTKNPGRGERVGERRNGERRERQRGIINEEGTGSHTHTNMGLGQIKPPSSQTVPYIHHIHHDLTSKLLWHLQSPFMPPRRSFKLNWKLIPGPFSSCAILETHQPLPTGLFI